VAERGEHLDVGSPQMAGGGNNTGEATREVARAERDDTPGAGRHQ
jgi:hypothetical protein